MKKIFISIFSTLFLVTSCVDMNQTPSYIITDEQMLSSEDGMQVYLARLYSLMPWEDFKYMAQWGFNYSSWLGALGIEGTGEAVNRDGISCAFTNEDNPWWDKCYTLVREANFLLENLPAYKDNYLEERYNDFLGQAYFARAFAYYQMARRYGGVPLLLHVSNDADLPRSSEEDTWNQVLADFDSAAELLAEDSYQRGQVNRYAALAFKAEAMLYAGSIAKYNQDFSDRLSYLGTKAPGVRIMGFDPDRWQEISIKYFSEAYKAAREVMKSNKYSLRTASGTDANSLYQNMVDMWRDLSSPENILVREYIYPTYTHGLDAYSSPYLWHHPLAGGTCPTLDFVELFDGFERYSDGTIRVTDGANCGDGHYLQFDDPMDFFANAEPRLRAYVIFPGDEFRGETVETRMGIYTGPETDIEPFFSDYSYTSSGQTYQQLEQYTGTPKTLYMSSTPTSIEYVEINGEQVSASGSCGPFYSYNEATLTGLHLRKYLDPDLSLEEIGEGMSDQPFILMRYADVLLAAAESAVELSMAGAQCPVAEDDMLQVATDAIQQIQRRAGANVIDEQLSGDVESRNIVRKERRKELAFENKTKWDIRRWRVQDADHRDGFWGETRDMSVCSNTNDYRVRGLYPFYSATTGKWFFDAHYQNLAQKTFSYRALDYYFAVPSGQVSKSAYIDQQPNR